MWVLKYTWDERVAKDDWRRDRISGNKSKVSILQLYIYIRQNYTMFSGYLKTAIKHIQKY